MTGFPAKVLVNGLPLPQPLVRAVHDGRWVAPRPEAQRPVFGESDETALFYSLEMIHRENAEWPGRKGPAFFGHPSRSQPPGDIDPARSVLIGDLGPDCMVALDYRTSIDTPCVVYLKREKPLWVRIAESVEELLDLLDRHGPSEVS